MQNNYAKKKVSRKQRQRHTINDEKKINSIR